MAKKYIDANKLMESMYHRAFETDGDTMWQSGCWVRYRAIEQIVKEQPTADVRENVRGNWVGIDDEPYTTWECDKCGCIYEEDFKYIPNFCPNCGADMRTKA